MKVSQKTSCIAILLLTFLSLLNVAETYAEVPVKTDSTDTWEPSDSVFVHYLEEQGIPVTSHNQLKLLTSGREKFECLFEDIRKAKHHVHLEYFNFRSDSIAKEMFTLLAEKAKEGVKVRAMFDAFGNLSNNRPLRKQHLQMLNDRGVEIVKFDPIRFPYINHVFSRDHQKIIVIDGQIGFTGGMNIADYYINGLRQPKNCRRLFCGHGTKKPDRTSRIPASSQ